MSLTKTPLDMLEAKGTPGSDVRYTGSEVIVEPDEDINNLGVASGFFDDSSGTLVIKLVNGQTLNITGFMTQGNIGVGEAGSQGIGGTSGTDGLLGEDGLQGPSGCAGPPGTPGATGTPGSMGPQGPEGPQGPTGDLGPEGEPGQVDVYIQTDDPGAVGSGAFWVKP
jgi:hypothetical protein